MRLAVLPFDTRVQGVVREHFRTCHQDPSRSSRTGPFRDSYLSFTPNSPLYIPILECLSMADVPGKSLIPSQRFRARPVPTASQLIVYRIYPRNRFLHHTFSAIALYVISI